MFGGIFKITHPRCFSNTNHRGSLNSYQAWCTLSNPIASSLKHYIFFIDKKARVSMCLAEELGGEKQTICPNRTVMWF